MVDRNRKRHLSYCSLLQLGKLGTVLPSHNGSLKAQCPAQAWLHSSSVLISALSRRISHEAHSVILVSTISLCSRATLLCTLLRPGRPLWKLGSYSVSVLECADVGETGREGGSVEPIPAQSSALLAVPPPHSPSVRPSHSFTPIQQCSGPCQTMTSDQLSATPSVPSGCCYTVVTQFIQQLYLTCYFL